MNRTMLLITALSLFILSGACWAQQTQPHDGMGGPSMVGGDGKSFQEHKAEILAHMNQHLSEIEQRRNCVQAANDRQALMACLPRREGREEEGHGGGFHHEGPQGPSDQQDNHH